MKKNISVTERIFPTPVLVVGTYDVNGKPNAITLAWGGVAASDPAAISIAVRPSRYSHEALMRTKVFTVNLPSARHADEVDFFGIVSGRKIDKFAATGLTPVRSEHVNAPYILEFPYIMECEVTHTLDLGSHTLFVGAVKGVKVDESLLDADNNLVWENAQILTFDAMRREYRSPGECVAQAFEAGTRFIDRT